MTTRVMIVDDHPVFRSGLRSAINATTDLNLVAEAVDGDQAITLARQTSPDVVLMDLRMPGLSGVETTKQIIAIAPAARVLVLTMSDDDESMFAALRAGAVGYLLKGDSEDDITHAIRAVHRGEALFGAGIAERLLDHVTGRARHDQAPFAELSPRETQILNLIAAGLGNAAIAARLSISPKTARNTVSIILTKIDARDRAHAIQIARAAGLGKT
jgi:DNA-binding NarL/FixJ family response regulator